MRAGSIGGDRALFRRPEVPRRGRSPHRCGGEDAARCELRRLRLRRLSGNGRRAGQTRGYFRVVLSGGRRRGDEAVRSVSGQDGSRKGGADRDRTLRRNVRQASPHEPVRRCTVMRRGCVALRGGDGLRLRLSGFRRLRERVRFRCALDGPRNGTSGGRRRQVHRLRRLRQGLSEGDHRTAQAVAQAPRRLCVVRLEGQGRRGDEGLQGGLYRLRQVRKGLCVRRDQGGEQPGLHRSVEVQTVP